MTAGDTTITFSGTRTVSTREGGFVQDIDGVILSVAGQKADGMVRAVGTCSVYSNPFKGRTSIECEANTDGYVATVSFYTDGSQPSIKRFD